VALNHSLILVRESSVETESDPHEGECLQKRDLASLQVSQQEENHLTACHMGKSCANGQTNLCPPQISLALSPPRLSKAERFIVPLEAARGCQLNTPAGVLDMRADGFIRILHGR
jgi:hypothetical protein